MKTVSIYVEDSSPTHLATWVSIDDATTSTSKGSRLNIRLNINILFW